MPPDSLPSPSSTPETCLRNLPVGSCGRVKGYREGCGTYRQKLLAMGLTPGTEFEIMRQAPMGDPVELKVRGFSLMLRKQEADSIVIEVNNHA